MRARQHVTRVHVRRKGGEQLVSEKDGEPAHRRASVLDILHQDKRLRGIGRVEVAAQGPGVVAARAGCDERMLFVRVVAGFAGVRLTVHHRLRVRREYARAEDRRSWRRPQDILRRESPPRNDISRRSRSTAKRRLQVIPLERERERQRILVAGNGRIESVRGRSGVKRARPDGHIVNRNPCGGACAADAVAGQEAAKRRTGHVRGGHALAIRERHRVRRAERECDLVPRRSRKRGNRKRHVRAGVVGERKRVRDGSGGGVEIGLHFQPHSGIRSGTKSEDASGRRQLLRIGPERDGPASRVEGIRIRQLKLRRLPVKVCARPSLVTRRPRTALLRREHDLRRLVAGGPSYAVALDKRRERYWRRHALLLDGR